MKAPSEEDPLAPAPEQPGSGSGASASTREPRQTPASGVRGAASDFFRLAPGMPGATEDLWGFARFAYLDNPLPARFKERLFIYLSRFCDARHCIARHLGFLASLDRPAGEPDALSVSQVMRLVRRRLPHGNDLRRHLAQVNTSAGGPFPEPGSPVEEAFFACAAHMFLQTGDAPDSLDALRQALHEQDFQHLLVFLAFVRTAHYWTQLQADLQLGTDDELLRATHQQLAEALCHDPEAADCEISQTLLKEFEFLRAGTKGNGGARPHERRRPGVVLAERLDELQRANEQSAESRRAALNLMEDAIQSRAALSRSEEKYRTLFESIDQGFYFAEAIFDAGGRCVDIFYHDENPAAVRLTGQSFKGCRLSEVGAYEPYWVEIFGVTARTGTPQRQERYAAPDGMWYDFYVFKPPTARGNEFAVVFRDVTERRRAEEAVRASEERLRLFVSASSEIVYRMSADWSEMYSLEGKQRIVSTHGPNAAWLETYIPADEQPRVLAAIAEAVRTRSVFALEHRCNGAEGGFVWVSSRAVPLLDERGEIVAWFGAASDVTVRRQAEETLRASEERQTFLLKLADALRPLDDPRAVQREACRIVRRQLGAARVAYGEMLPDGMQGIATAEDTVEGAMSLLGFSVNWADLDPTGLQTLNTGEIIHRADVQAAEGLTPAQKANMAALGFRAFLAAPLVKAGRLIAFFLVHFDAAHAATPHEIALLEETAERTWAAVERARAEAALRASEERLQIMAANLPGGAAFIVDRDLRYRLAEGEALRDVGFQPEDLVGKTIFEALPPELATGYEPYFRQALAGEPFTHEHESHGRTFVTRGAPLRRVDGETYAVLAVSYDITERNRAEMSLRVSEEEYRTLFSSIDEGFCTLEVLFDAAGRAFDYRILTANPAFARQTGLTDAVGKTVREFIPELEAFWFETYGRVARTGEATRFEHEAAPLGRFYDVYAFRIGAPQEGRIAVIFNDITGRKEAATTLERTGEQLRIALADAEAANAAKDHFLAVLSHELRTPLMPITMALAALNRRSDLPEAVQKIHAMIQRNVALEAHFIDDLLDVTRISRGKMEIVRNPMDLHEALERAVEVSTADVEGKGQRLTVTLEAGGHRLEGDFARLQQAAWNLLKNASKFTPREGEIHLRTCNEEPGRIVVEVTDSGIGMEPEALARVFQPFEQADVTITRQYGGLGLGLAIAKGTVEAHGGTLRASSPGLGQGATFTVSLPLL